MLIQIIIFLVSLLALLKASDILVDSAVDLSEHLGISPFIIGMTVVAVGTSLPEVAASVAAAIDGYSEIALGNVIGSNICNVGLVLGVAAIASGVNCHRAILKREGAIMIIVTAVFWIIATINKEINASIGVIFLVSFWIFMALLVRWGLVGEEGEETKEKNEVGGLSKMALFMVVAIGVVLFSSDYLVQSVVFLAAEFGVSQNVIAISVVAFGTSIPELSVSIVSARKNQGDVLVGNIIGSNVSNILLVIGAASTISPITVSSSSLLIDFPLMMGFSLLMVYFLYHDMGITRRKGLILLGLYIFVIVRCFVYQ